MSSAKHPRPKPRAPHPTAAPARMQAPLEHQARRTNRSPASPIVGINNCESCSANDHNPQPSRPRGAGRTPISTARSDPDRLLSWQRHQCWSRSRARAAPEPKTASICVIVTRTEVSHTGTTNHGATPKGMTRLHHDETPTLVAIGLHTHFVAVMPARRG